MKKITKKLVLNKKTIAHLTEVEQAVVQGGVYTKPVCRETDLPAASCPISCTFWIGSCEMC